ncbi:MAG TPA: hypothetical protein DDW67_07635, partial [Elusimicrobia bacterium]|nr:hypothetical protein [Elusimicrobiota bacterium]
MVERDIAFAALSVLWLPALPLRRLGAAAYWLAGLAGLGLAFYAYSASGSVSGMTLPVVWAAVSCQWVISRRPGG